MHSGLCGHYHIHCDPLLGVGLKAIKIIPCFCESCIDTIKSEWLEDKKPTEQPHFQRNVNLKYASVFYRDEGYNDWKITETRENPGNEKLDVDALKLELLSGIAERTGKRVSEKMYGAIMKDDNKKMDIIL